MHGILVCAGNATRFAEPMRVTTPFPKQLLQVNGKTILERSLLTMLRFFDIHSITLATHPKLGETYLTYLYQLQMHYSNIEFSMLTLTTSREGVNAEKIAGIMLRNGIVTVNGDQKNVDRNEMCIVEPGRSRGSKYYYATSRRRNTIRV